MFKILKPYLQNHFVLACSGGVDSMVLAKLLTEIMPDPSKQLHLVYIDHGQRTKKEILKDWNIVLSFSEKHKIHASKFKLNLKKNASENVMRKKRYEILAKIAAKNNSILLTAHHEDDVLESILLKIMRGAHPDSLDSILENQIIEIQKNKIHLIRPLLNLSKNEIIKIAKTKKLKWSEDKTNKSSKYSRNRVRNELIPLMNEIRDNASGQMKEFFLSIIRQNQKRAHITKQVDLNEPNGLEVKNTNFWELKRSIDRELGEASQRTTKAHWENLKRQIELRHATKNGGGPLKSLQFPGGYQLEFKGNRLFWKPTR